MAGGHVSRRGILTASLFGGASLLASTALAQGPFRGIPWIPGTSPAPRPYAGARFLTSSERRALDALVARLIPADDLGPGAREAGVVDFIDSQLAGAFGRGERWYMKGPFEDGLKTQGYQSEHPPAGLYRAALDALDAHCRDNFDGRDFADLTEEEQDTLIGRMEEDELELADISGATFFEMLHDNTVEGFFSDPIYGGNRDMAGWRLIGFPGVRYDYRDYLDHNGAAIRIEPVGLKGRAEWNVD